MEHESNGGNPLIRALRDVCRASVHLERLEHERRTAERVLGNSWESYRQLLENDATALLLTDPQGAIVASNTASQTLLGYTAGELVSTNLEDLYGEDGSSQFAESLREVFDESALTIKGLSALRKDGSAIPVDTLLVAVTHEDKSMIQVALHETAERPKAQPDSKGYVERLELLSRSTTSLLSLPPTGNLYKALGDQVAAFVGNAYVVVSSSSKEPNTFSVQAVSGPKKQAEITTGSLLRHLAGVSFHLSQQEFQQYVTTCTPVSVSGGLPNLFLDRLPRDVYDAIQDIFLFGRTYVAGLTSDGEVFGMVTILMAKDLKLEHTQLVATLIEQASLVLRLRAEERAHSDTTYPETLVEDFQNILMEELPLPLEHQELPRHRGWDQHALKEPTNKVAEEVARQPEKKPMAAVAEPPVTEPVKEEPKKPEPELEPELDYRHLRHLLGHKKVLVVDGEEIIRDVTGGLLSYMGCRVGFAKDGYDGVNQYKKAMISGEPYDAVILALALPGDLSPKETCQKLRQIDPAVRVVGSTGAAGESLVTDAREAGFQAVIVRPYKGERLANILHKVLNEPDSLHKRRA